MVKELSQEAQAEKAQEMTRKPATGTQREVIDAARSICREYDYIGELLEGDNEFEQLIAAQTLVFKQPGVAAWLLMASLWRLEEIGYLDTLMEQTT